MSPSEHIALRVRVNHDILDKVAALLGDWHRLEFHLEY